MHQKLYSKAFTRGGMHHSAASQLYHLRSWSAVHIATRRQYLSQRARTVKGVTPRTKVSIAMTLGTALQHLQEDGCVYLDYNATTPIFPEVRQRAARHGA